jgi:hypothetical protein
LSFKELRADLIDLQQRFTIEVNELKAKYFVEGKGLDPLLKTPECKYGINFAINVGNLKHSEL